MFNQNTVFVLGAGSSHEIGLPIGVELAKTIATHLNIRPRNDGSHSGDKRIAEAIDFLARERRINLSF